MITKSLDEPLRLTTSVPSAFSTVGLRLVQLDFQLPGLQRRKRNKWPDSEYVDPCAADVAERPGHYLDYDTDTGEIVSKEGLSESARQKALNSIHDLGLNRLDVRFYRLQWTDSSLSIYSPFRFRKTGFR